MKCDICQERSPERNITKGTERVATVCGKCHHTFEEALRAAIKKSLDAMLHDLMNGDDSIASTTRGLLND